MSDLFQRGAAFLAAGLKAGASQTVVYHRGSTTVSLSATLGRFGVGFTDFGGTLLANDDLDFLVTAADLGFEPTANDWIAYDGRKHIVGRPDGGSQRCFEADEYAVSYRIHTKRGAAI